MASCGEVDEVSGEPFETVSSAITAQNLQEGDYLFQGQALVSSLCYFRLAMQGDGNLVVYGGPGDSNPIGDSDTDHPPPGYVAAFAKLQGDGNFVVGSLGGNPLWSTHTQGSPSTRLQMQNDGNLVLYSGSHSVWSTHTAQPQAAWNCAEVPRSEATRVVGNLDFPGNDLPGMPLRMRTGSPFWCGVECGKRSNCEAWTFVPRPADYSTAGGAACWLKSAIPTGVTGPNMTSGYKIRP